MQIEHNHFLLFFEWMANNTLYNLGIRGSLRTILLSCMYGSPRDIVRCVVKRCY